MQLQGFKWRDRLRNEDGMSLVEILVSIVIITIVLGGTAQIMIDTFSIQQNTESQSKSVQLARDYMERSKQASFNELGFYETDEGFRATTNIKNPQTGNNEKTFIIPIEQKRSTMIPTDTRTVGGIVYDIRVDITTDNLSDKYAPKRVTVDVSWLDANKKTQHTIMSIVRTPSASEQIPPALDLTELPGADGKPSSPSFYDAINMYAGTASDVLGREFSVKVAHPGTSPVTDIQFKVYCSGSDSGPSTTISWKTPPSGWTATSSADTYYLGYYGSPTGLGCQIDTAMTEVVAINGSGASTPMTILPSNFLKY